MAKYCKKKAKQQKSVKNWQNGRIVLQNTKRDSDKRWANWHKSAKNWQWCNSIKML